MIVKNNHAEGYDDMDHMLEGNERILVCLSPSPSNKKVVAAAVKMAQAFHAALTAIYIKPTNYNLISEKDKQRLRSNIEYAERSGASIATIIGNDVPIQIVEYAHISGATKIIVGRSGARRRHFWSKAPLTEQIILNAPDLDVYIIPDSAADLKLQRERTHLGDQIRPTWKDTLICILLLIAAVAVGLLFTRFGFSKSNIITVFILGVLVISVMTASPLYSVVGSLASVLLFNWFFIEPRFSFHTYEPEYAVTFAIMLTSALITGTLANKLKSNSRQAAREAFRAKVLFDTNQLLQSAESAQDVIRITAHQTITLLDRDVVVYPLEDGGIGSGIRFSAPQSAGDDVSPEENEQEIVSWVFEHQQAAGFRLEKYSAAKAQYHPICINGHCYGIVAVNLDGTSLETFEYSVLMSILGECALAMESLQNAAEKEQASVMARNEQLRANLLRSISHDIRTPLTSISGNASNLLSHDRQLDDETRRQIFSDIYDDSEWLIDLVENLLSISRIENGQMELHLSAEVMNDVAAEALKHIDRNANQHKIILEETDALLLVKMDPRLIMQVLINLINNAIKNTQKGSEIRIRCTQDKQTVYVSVSDNGPGIPDDIKPHIFEMFYTGQNGIADGRRGLGLGLALCKSIIEAHRGTITLTDNHPTGCCFTFTLPVEEVQINE